MMFPISIRKLCALYFIAMLVSGTVKAQQKETVVRATADWLLFRGDADRNGSTPGFPPNLEKALLKNSLLEKSRQETVRIVQRTLKLQPATKPSCPGFTPIVCKGRLIYRTYAGVHAIELLNGETSWTSHLASLRGLDGILRNLDTRELMHGWIADSDQGGKSIALFENSLTGSLSANGNRVYFVDDLTLVPHQKIPNTWGGRAAFEDALMLSNRLGAIDLETGRLAWERGDSAVDKSDLGKIFFLGPPLPLDGSLFVPFEKDAKLCIGCLKPESGTLTWSVPIGDFRRVLTADPGRRMQAAHLAAAGGMLIVPSHAGWIAGFDLKTRKVKWNFKYRPENPAFLTELVPDWKASAALCAYDKIVFTAPDGTAVFCLNAADGSLAWKVKRDNDLYLAGVYEGRVLLVGNSRCRALGLNGGKELWRLETGIPSGLGVMSGNQYYLPLKAAAGSGKAEICTFKISNGQMAAHHIAAENDVPGNLLFHGNLLISQTETRIATYGAKK